MRIEDFYNPNNDTMPSRRMSSEFAPITRHGRDYNHSFGRLYGKQQMDQLILLCLDKLIGDEKQHAMDRFEETLTQEDKRWDPIKHQYVHKSVRGMWNHFMLAWCMAKDYI